MLFDHISQAAIGGNMTLMIKASTRMGFAAIGFDCGFFTKHNAAATNGKPAKMHHMPIIWATIIRVILAHWRCHDAVADFKSAQFCWGEKQRGIR